jgi:hypothetical protein
MKIKSIQFNDNTWFSPNDRAGEELSLSLDDFDTELPDKVILSTINKKGDRVIAGWFIMTSIKYIKFYHRGEVNDRN